MRLKNLVVQGFKSFAYSIAVEFAPGLNVVVGPNGSGKSNIIDALRWVLGDHYREMRVSQNREVIFHGSPAAKPLGMAFIETEWIDEAGDAFHISRKLFGSGESEYAFNRNRIRLKELREQVYKKGFPGETIGVNVVDTGKLQILFDYRPAERYRLFEMSSGLYGMKQRLLRIGSQVTRVSEKLERLRDRISEISLQENRVARLAQDEKGFLELMTEIRELKRIFLDRSIAERKKKLNDLIKEISEIDRAVDMTDYWLDQHSGILESLKEKYEKCQSDQETLNASISRLNEERQTAERELYGFLTRARQRSWSVYEAQVALHQIEKESLRLEKKLVDVRSVLEESLSLEEEIAELIRERGQAREGERKAFEELFRIQEACSLSTGFYRQNENEKNDLEEEMSDLAGELVRTRQKFVQESEKLETLKLQEADCTRQKAAVQEHLNRVSHLVRRVEKKAGSYLQAGKIGEDWRARIEGMGESGWSGTLLYALGWLMRDKEIFSDDTSWEKETLIGSGRVMIHRNLIPSSSGWSVVALSTIVDLFLQGKRPDDNLVSRGGELLYLRSGFLYYPKKVLFEERGGRFFRSFNRRREAWRAKEKNLEQALSANDRRYSETKHQRLKQENEIGRRQERMDLLEAELAKKQDRLKKISERLQELAVALRDRQREIAQGETNLSFWREKGQQLETVLAEKEKRLLHWERMRAGRERLQAETAHLRQDYNRSVATIHSIQVGMFSSEKELSELANRLSETRSSLEQCQATLRCVQDEYRKLGLERNSLRRQCEEEKSKKESNLKRRDKFYFLKEKMHYETQEFERRQEELGHFSSPPQIEPSYRDQAVLEKLIREKEARLQTLNVRRGAIEEYAELKERGDALRAKLTGFEEGLSRFQREFFQCDRELRERFFQYVAKVNALFIEYFTRVFGGGEAGVVLAGDGLEITIRIPGKRRQSLSLLSSGEKALCGLCLFLSLFRAGSFVFCFFDEVDANLDHFNSSRLAEVLREYAEQCQIVIVTHQEEIMEIADRIIGVTMAEPGVSRVIPLDNLRQVDQLETSKR
ncbi:MAG TPA: AAA family ATPase [Atribacteraceae bacterium]|nr:AAA family ATPase [Atribacteraceae bacterium]